MKEKQAVTREYKTLYQAATKKAKPALLDEFTRLTGYHRTYAARVLSGNLYKCKITFHPAGSPKFAADTLEMRGEIGLGIGRSQFWRKSSREEASGLR